MTESEVARFRRQLDEELEAMKQGMSGLAEVAAHKFVQSKMHRLGEIELGLAPLVGEAQAWQTVYEAYVRVVG